MIENSMKRFAWVYPVSIGISCIACVLLSLTLGTDIIPDGWFIEALFASKVLFGIAAVFAFSFAISLSPWQRPVVSTPIGLIIPALYAAEGLMGGPVEAQFIVPMINIVPSVLSLICTVRIMRYTTNPGVRIEKNETIIDPVRCGGCTDERKHAICEEYRAKMNPR